MLLLTIILLSGQEVHLNPREVIAIIQARDADDPMKHYTKEVRCVVEMSNNREFTTREECGSIEKRYEKLLAELKEKKP